MSEPNLRRTSLIRRSSRDATLFQVEKMRLGKIARAAGERTQMAHRAFKTALASGDYDDLAKASQVASQALHDWCRICQIPMPPRPKDGNRPIIDMGMLQELPDDTSLVESLRSKPAQAAAPAQPSPTPEPAPSPMVDVDQAINPG